METIEIVILVLAIALVLFTVGFAIYKKKKGKKSGGSSCTGCANCEHSAFCGSAEKDLDSKDEEES